MFVERNIDSLVHKSGIVQQVNTGRALNENGPGRAWPKLQRAGPGRKSQARSHLWSASVISEPATLTEFK
jgi:hypothetical protein